MLEIDIELAKLKFPTTMYEIDKVTSNLRMEGKTPTMLFISINLIIKLMDEANGLYTQVKSFPLYTKEQLISMPQIDLVYKGCKVYRIIEDNIIVVQ